MARIRFSTALSSARGSTGSVTYKKVKNRFEMSTRSFDVENPNTPAQQLVRVAFTTASRTFKNATTAQVLAWDTFAENNPPTYDSGINAFMKLAIKYLLVNPGGTIPMTPPTSAFTGDTIKVSAAAAAGKITFTASAANASGVATELLFQSLKSKNRKPGKAYKTGVYIEFKTTLTKDVAVPPGYYAAGYRFVNTATGQASDLQTLTVSGPVTFSIAEGKGDKKAA